MTENDSRSERPDSTESALEGAGSPSPSIPMFKDRKTGLAAFGVVQLLIAVAILGMSLLQFAMAAGGDKFAPPGSAPLSKSGMIAGGFFYLVLGALAVVLGLGSIYCRRWARAINLVLAFYGLAIGVVSIVALGLTMPGLRRNLESQMAGAQPGVGFLIGCMIVGMVLAYLILPGAFVLFFRSRHVKATCEFYDSKARWTDSRPLPVLAGSLLLLCGCASLITPVMGLGVPLFGWIAKGVWAWIVSAAFGLASAVLAWGFFNLRRWAWLGALGFTVLAGLNGLVMFWGNDGLDFYEQMQLPPEQVDMMQEMGFAGWMAPTMAVTLLSMLGFYFWLGRYFEREPSF